MSFRDIAWKVYQQLDDGLWSPLFSEIEHKLSNLETLNCNKCGKDYKVGEISRWKKPININKAWGYESSSKDMTYDTWRFCDDCSIEFNKSHHPICSSCRKSIPEVMGYLASMNEGHSFLGKEAEAIEFFKNKDNHCGLEFAEINDAIFCEICYEKLISTFKNKDVWHVYRDMGGEQLKIEFDDSTSLPGRLNEITKRFDYGN